MGLCNLWRAIWRLCNFMNRINNVNSVKWGVKVLHISTRPIMVESTDSSVYTTKIILYYIEDNTKEGWIKAQA